MEDAWDRLFDDKLYELTPNFLSKTCEKILEFLSPIKQGRRSGYILQNRFSSSAVSPFYIYDDLR